MEQRTRVIIIGAVVLFLVAIAGGITFYLSKASPKGTSAGGGGSLSALPTISFSPTPSPTLTGTRSASKALTVSGLTFNYPSSWGLLTCGNSQNFELDPTNGADLKDVVCDRAVKPITFLFTNYLNCQGEKVNIASYPVIRSKTSSDGDISYRWCLLVGDHGLDITHRVSPSGGRATSKEDFSQEVERVIANIKKL